MWLVCYEVHGKMHFSTFSNHGEALACLEQDALYYEQEWGAENFRIYLAEVREAR